MSRLIYDKYQTLMIKLQATREKYVIENYFSYFSTKTYVVTCRYLKDPSL